MERRLESLVLLGYAMFSCGIILGVFYCFNREKAYYSMSKRERAIEKIRKTSDYFEKKKHIPFIYNKEKIENFVEMKYGRK